MNAVAATLVYNTPDLAQRMADQMRGCDFFVVDNGSDPFISLQNSDAVVLSWGKNFKFSGGWQRFCEYMTALGTVEWVWLLNSDVEGVSAEMFYTLVEAAQSLEHCAGITPAFNSPHSSFRRRTGGGVDEVKWLDFCCPLLNLDVWEDLGGFDTQFVGYGMDIDYCWRARKKGWKFYVHHGCEVTHVGSVTAKQEHLIGEQNNLAEMERLLRQKWKVQRWQEMLR